ncbi:MAG: DUF6452 family protein [Bacteroidia bacterium]|nr:DUF6452 family protein [Bacteroidia bacterium]
MAIVLLLPSCTPGSCFEETNSYVKAAFYLESNGKKTSPDTLTLYGIGRDTSTIYKKSRSVGQALLPLDASSEECGFVIRINGISDTISFTYSTAIHMISKECGYTFYHTIEMPVYTKRMIDTVTVTKSTITTLNEENIRIYY